jgi:gliding motility-associated-like protein
MKFPAYILFFLSIILSQILPAQTIQKDTKLECDSMLLKFYHESGSGHSVLWTFSDNTKTATTDTVWHRYKAPGFYHVTVAIDGGIPVDSLVKVGKRPVSYIYYRDTSELGPLTYVIGAYCPDKYKHSYEWSPSAIFAPGDTSFFIHQFPISGIDSVHLIVKESIDGCVYSTYRNLEITDQITAPDIFTPNNDGHNDEFIVKSNGRYYISLKIFTRTGQLLYKTEAKNINWDGTLVNGDKVQPGIYYYIIETLDANPVVRKMGFVYIYP